MPSSACKKHGDTICARALHPPACRRPAPLAVHPSAASPLRLHGPARAAPHGRPPVAASSVFFFSDAAPTEISPLPLHDALPICHIGLEAEGHEIAFRNIKLTTLP